MTEKHLVHDATRPEMIDKINKISDDLEELLEIFRTIKGGVKFFVLTSKVFQWIATVGGALIAIASTILALIHFSKTGKLPFEH